jgi:Trypsin
LNFFSQYNDIAILTLASPIQYTASISPVCLPNIGDTNQYINYEAAVIGWGASREGFKFLFFFLNK